MLKQILLAGTMMVASPVLAQTAPDQTQTAPTQATTGTGTQARPAASAADSATTQDAATVQDQAGTGTPADGTAVAQQAAPAGQQAASGSQVAQVVDQEFPTYDKDGNGALNKTEFASWMVALKAQTDPATKAESPQTKAWVNGAFAQADKDKSSTVSKPELLGFLSQGQS